MSLKELMKQIQERAVLASDDLKDATYKTSAVRTANKKAAEEALKDLKDEYRRLLLSTSVYLVVTGNQAGDLGSLADSESKCFNADAEDLYKKVVSKIHPNAYLNKTVTGATIEILNNSFEEVAQESGVREYNQLLYKPQYAQVVTSKEQFVEVTKQVINDNVGGEMVGVYTVNGVLEESVKRNHSESFTPVLLVAKDEQLAITLSKDLKRLSPNVFVVSVGKASKAIKSLPNTVGIKEASKEALEQLLAGIKSKLSQ